MFRVWLRVMHQGVALKNVHLGCKYINKLTGVVFHLCHVHLLSVYIPPKVDRIWLWVYHNKIPIYPILYLFMGDYRFSSFGLVTLWTHGDVCRHVQVQPPMVQCQTIVPLK